ncbi:phosphoribosylanthranilate isomerase [Sphingomonas sp.]|uniref:phosphoribosylanthranilate isomerase n=1 Tax=Sphingomonas sp. TaxID=28214 RepID=UPI001EBCB62E|nr:phosphoribosylanthranilate isomerase [Sphingomonas sp.]MBX3595137.1 phosphoribosylanthranilate isomerase [Sphingomonas sp.]
MRVTAKICGLSAVEVMDTAIAGGAAHIGFVFFPPSPRHVTFDRATALGARVPDRVGRVGVFVDPEDALLDQAIGAARLDAIQLHRASPQRAAAIGARTRLPVWAAVPVKTREDLATAHAFRGAAQRILYDAKTPDDARLPGGMGLRFDWALLDGFAHPLPWALSGGLDAENVADAVRITGARLVDVSSGVESAPGVKDVAKVAAFLETVAAL